MPKSGTDISRRRRIVMGHHSLKPSDSSVCEYCREETSLAYYKPDTCDCSVCYYCLSNSFYEERYIIPDYSCCCCGEEY